MMPIQIVLFIFLQVLSFSYSNSKLTIETVDPLQDKMVGLWSTPILKRTLLSKEKQVINMELKQLILQSFQEFQEKSKWKGSFSSTKKDGLNDLFFAHQKKYWEDNNKLWPPLEKSPVVQGLKDAIKSLSARYLYSSDPQNGKRYPNQLQIYLWAGIHFGCVAHLQHYHPNSAVSGTYYVSTPKGSGDLVLSDPRGLLPPFGGRYIHHPKAGEVILFPSWLRHEVAPSCKLTSRNPRVALSFNIIGDWEQTNDATSLFFDLAPAAPSSTEL
jgi:hypothetical protein